MFGLLHAKIGADMVKKKYGFTREMQEAIKHHTVGNEYMSMLDKIVFVADKIDETREFDGVEELRELAMQDIDSCVLVILDEAIKKSINKGVLIHPNTVLARNYFMRKMMSE